MRWLVLTVILLAAPVSAQDRPGAFDYYLLSLSWTPSWCDREGDDRRDARCDDGSGWGFGVHGLWPQYEEGWPEFCQSPHRPPSRTETAAMGDIMGSSGLAWHQWRKHGSCSGLAPRDYFALTRRAFGAITMPEVFALIDRDLRIDPDVVEEAFTEANRDLPPDAIIVTCRDGQVDEVRICLTRELRPRDCGEDVLRRTCTASQAMLPALR